MRASLLFAIGCLLVGCGDDGGGTTTPDGGDTGGTPTVVETRPAADGLGDARGKVVARFSLPMAPGSLTETSFQLRAAGQLVNGRVATAGNEATFTPDVPMSPGVMITATIDGATSTLGVAAAAHSWSFTTNRAFAAPVLLESEDGGSADEPAVAAAGDGSTLAIWRQFDGTRFNLMGSRAPGAAAASAAFPLESSDDNVNVAPRVGMDATGHAILLYTHSTTGGANSVWARALPPPGMAATPPEELSSAVASIALALAVAPDGRAAAAFASGRGLTVRRYTPGDGWGAAEQLASSGSPTAAQLVIDAQGGVTCVWSENPGDVIARHAASGGAFSAAVVLEPLDTSPTSAPGLALLGDGARVAVWQQGGGVWAARSADGITWAAPVRVSPAGVPAFAPRVGGGAAALVIWQAASGGGTISGARLEPGGWSAPVMLDGTDGSVTSDLVGDGAGRGLGLWFSPAGRTLRAARYLPGAGFSTPIAPDRQPFAGIDARAALLPDGRAVIVWHQYDGTRFNAYFTVQR